MGQNTKPITGGCLCGAVRYETTAEPIGACHCHCDRCRRHTGSLFASAVGFSTEDITWTKEPPAMFQSSDNCGRLFCARCGSTLGQQWLDIGTLWPYIGTLDDPEAVTPEFHMYTDEQISWVALDDGLPRYPAFPTTRKGKDGAKPPPR